MIPSTPAEPVGDAYEEYAQQKGLDYSFQETVDPEYPKRIIIETWNPNWRHWQAFFDRQYEALLARKRADDGE